MSALKFAIKLILVTIAVALILSGLFRFQSSIDDFFYIGRIVQSCDECNRTFEARTEFGDDPYLIKEYCIKEESIFSNEYRCIDPTRYWGIK
jgi:hypothetical protein